MAVQHAFLIDEHIAEHVARKLRRLGHSVVRVRSRRRQSLADRQVIELARNEKRAVITRDWDDYIALHNEGIRHEGIFVCRRDDAQLRIADKVHELAKDRPHLTQQLFQISDD